MSRLFDEILALLEREVARAAWDSDQTLRQAETLHTWSREVLERAPDKAAAARDLGAVLARLSELGYTDVVTGDATVARICEARVRNRGKLAELRRLIAEYRSTPRRLDETSDPARLDRLLAQLYEHPGESYRALLLEREDPVVRELLARLPRYVRK